MEFAQWVLSELDQFRAGQLPGGEALRDAVAAGLGDSAVLDAYLTSGDDAARATLVQAVAQAVAADPAFEQQVRQAAEGAQSSDPATEAAPEQSGPQAVPTIAQGSESAGGGEPAKLPFFKTTNGMLALVAAAVVVVGGGVGLGVGLSGGDSTSSGLATVMKGIWHCRGAAGDAGTITIGDGTWTVGGAKGGWKQNGGTATISNDAHRGDDVQITGLPGGPGPFDVTMRPTSAADSSTVRLRGSVTEHQLAFTVEMSGAQSPTLNCTK